LDSPRVILAVDTSTAAGSVVVWAQGAIRAERVRVTKAVGPELITEIQAALDAARCELRSVDLFACGLGPGAFTGLRVGLATVKGFAYAMSRPAAGVSSLEALALRARTFVQGDAVIAPVIDARRGEVYAAAFNSCGERVLPELAFEPEALGEALRALDCEVRAVGAGAHLYRDRIGVPLFEGEGLDAPHAAEVAVIAARDISTGACVGEALFDLAPTYVRPADAEAPLPLRDAPRR
jgi:tRNA threonylcarbamoyladenosine biosynthesis protein TsaB